MSAKRTLAVVSVLAFLVACSQGRGLFKRAEPVPTPQVKVASVKKPSSTAANPSLTVVRAEPRKKKLKLPRVLAKIPNILAKPFEAPTDTVDLAASTTRSDTMEGCDPSLAAHIPARANNALPGSELARESMTLGGTERDAFLSQKLMEGNVPDFMRKLTPVVFRGNASDGKDVVVVICVTPDYLAVGDDSDFVRVPMGLPAAAEVATDFGFVLPTTKMVDAIYKQAGLHLIPAPMQAGSQMTSTKYLWQHNRTVEGQRLAAHDAPETLVAGQKKDLVLSNVLRSAPGRVAIYGWHRQNGVPIQPLSTVHGKNYADYSHGVRLVSTTVAVNGKARNLADVLEDPTLSRIVSKEGPIIHPVRLIAALAAN